MRIWLRIGQSDALCASHHYRDSEKCAMSQRFTQLLSSTVRNGGFSLAYLAQFRKLLVRAAAAVSEVFPSRYLWISKAQNMHARFASWLRSTGPCVCHRGHSHSVVKPSVCWRVSSALAKVSSTSSRKQSQSPMTALWRLFIYSFIYFVGSFVRIRCSVALLVSRVSFSMRYSPRALAH